MSDANEHLIPRHRLLTEISELLAQVTGDQIPAIRLLNSRRPYSL
jgi:hypothetical protein